MNPSLDKLLNDLEGVRSTGDNAWQACCPVHEDNTASLSIAYRGNSILMKCHAGCDTKNVVAASGLEWKDLFPSPRATNGKGRTVVAAYDYHDEDGSVLFQAVRLEPKDFRQRKPKPGGVWDWSVKGCKVVPYRLPALVKADPTRVVFVVEGEKDVDRLRQLELVATCNSGGAGKWKAAHSKRLKGRHVVILADNDKAGRKHAQQVAKSLNGVAASVKIVYLPDLPEKGDVSDWLDAGGTAEKLLEIVKATPEWDPEEEEEPSEHELGFVASVSSFITEADHFAKDSGGKMFRYNRGCYRSKAEAFIKIKVKQICVSLGATKKWSKRFSEEVIEFIRVDAPELWERPPIDVVNVENGLLRLSDRVLLPHSKKHLSSTQLPVKYDPKATCPALEKFVGEVFPLDAQELAWELPALLMAPDTSIQKAVLLLGAGGNGKSAYLAAVIAFLGKNNTSSVSLHRLESDRFAAARLIGKLANICADLPTEHLDGTSLFKALTGGDSIEAERKFCDSFQFEPFARLLFSANSPPRSQDASEGFFDRWLVVPFDARFRGSKKEVSRKELDARLSSPGELSGMLNHAAQAWRNIQERGRLSEPESVRKAWQEFHAMTDPMSAWLDQFTVDDRDAIVSKTVLRTAYGAACERSGRPAPTDNAFGRAMSKARPNVTTGQRRINGRKQWCYLGICLRADESQVSHESQHYPLLTSTTNRTRENDLSEGDEVSTEQVGAIPVIAVTPVTQNGTRDPESTGPNREVLSL